MRTPTGSFEVDETLLRDENAMCNIDRLGDASHDRAMTEIEISGRGM